MSLVFVVWFFSGIFLIFDGFPHASREKRFLHLTEFNAQHLQNIKAPPSKFRGKVELEICDEKLVYRVYSGRKTQKVYDALSLQPVAPYSSEFAGKLSGSFVGHPVKKIKKQDEPDQWIPWSYYKPLLPFYKCYMNDPKYTVLYISEKAGTIVQQTTRKERWSARFGSIPHWIYFKRLRLLPGIWHIVVVVLSSLGLLVSVSGIYTGLKRLRKQKKGKGITPYKKVWYKWHHITGFVFGIFVFTFLLSGLISVTDIPDWMVCIKKSEKERIIWNQKPDLPGHKNISPIQVFNSLEKKTGIRRMVWKTVFNEPQFWVYYNNYQIPEVYCLKSGEIEPVAPYSLSQIKKQAQKLFPEIPFSIITQAAYDSYYLASRMHYLPQPVYKIELDNADQTWLYINPATGEEVKRHIKNTRLRRWLYRALHTFNFPILNKAEWLRKTILIVLSIGGLAVSISGFVLSVRWFNRKLNKLTD